MKKHDWYIGETAEGGRFVCLMMFLWLCCVIFYDKTFAYLQIGPVYITEVVLSILVLTNLSRLRMADIFMLGLITFFIIGGWRRHGSFFFAGKDLVWMPYLLFLRFFPRNFPSSYIEIVKKCAFVKIIFMLLPNVAAMLYIPNPKYLNGILLLFCLTWVKIFSPKSYMLPMFVLAIIVAVVINFKTCLIIVGIAPIFFNLKFDISWVFSRKSLFAVAGVVLIMAFTNTIEQVLAGSVDILNSSFSFFGIDRKYSLGTSVWRSQIWMFGIRNLVRDGSLLFGQFPGFNFLDAHYLNIKIALYGGDGLGVVRTAHNIIVQMVMKAGLVGLSAFIWYYFTAFQQKERNLVYFQLGVFVMAMTADILEVPTRGPLFYSLLVCLQITAQRRAKEVRRLQLAST